MALTLEVLRQLEKAGLTNFYDENARAWLAMAREPVPMSKKDLATLRCAPMTLPKFFILLLQSILPLMRSLIERSSNKNIGKETLRTWC